MVGKDPNTRHTNFISDFKLKVFTISCLKMGEVQSSILQAVQ